MENFLSIPTPTKTGSDASSELLSQESGMDKVPSSRSSVSPGTPRVPDALDLSVIVGFAFRFPGASNTTALWDLLAEKRDVRSKIREDRFDMDAYHHPIATNKGTTNAQYGYFLDEPLDEFDNEFFGISVKEAEAMDPQQRLLLEVVYEALENAGITLEQVRGSRASVFVGSFSNDYNTMVCQDAGVYPKYTIIGGGNSIMSNRISYFFDLHGPSMTIDTACSSSLVCFHMGNQSLQHGDADISIVCGSALNFDPNIWITMSDLGMLASDGRSRAFDAERSGFARGEGVVAMVLKRRSDAEAAGDSVRAVVRGTSTNHDGSKAGLTVPNGDAQAALIKQTYAEAGIDPSATDYFEAHGTGTAVGDPIEAAAIGSVFAPIRDEPLYVGSIKSNLGHLEGAAGLAGIVKATMAIEAAKILPNMHFNTPNPSIDFEALKIAVPTEVMDWKSATGRRRASVNSFGYGGSNAHAIIENYYPEGMGASGSPAVTAITLSDPDKAADRPFLIPLTSHGAKAATNLLSHLSDYIKRSKDLAVSDLAYSYSVRRSMHQQRWFVVGRGTDSVLDSLASPLAPDKWTRKQDSRPRIGMVFTGQGAQWHAMGRELLTESPLFRQTIERCDAVLKSLPDAPDWTCLGELQRSAEESRLSESLISQPLCAALQLALVEHLRAWGIVPNGVVGHSSGEIAAAYAAGVLSFDNAIICAYYRGLHMSHGVQPDASNKKGAMIAVGLTEAEGIAELAPYSGRVALAAVNSPSSLTFSGDEDAILEIKQSLDNRKVFARRLLVEQAFHSHHMDPLAPSFERALRRTPGFGPMPAAIQFVSSVTARASTARKMDASYWAANMTGVVRFSDALTGILLDEDDEQNIDVLVEIGPHPALRGPARQVAKSCKLEIPYFGALSRDQPAFEALLRTAGELFAMGYPVDLAAANSHLHTDTSGVIRQTTPGTLLRDLPSYSWNHGSYWATTRKIRDRQHPGHRHTILGTPIPGQAHNHPSWRVFLRLSEVPWLSQHVIDGKVVFPAAGYVSMALEAMERIAQGKDVKEYQMRDVSFKAPLILDSDDAGIEVIFQLQPLATSAKSVSSTWYRFSVCSFASNGDKSSMPKQQRDVMQEHCHGLVRAVAGEPCVLKGGVAPGMGSTAIDRRTRGDVFYSRLRRIGMEYGENFRLLDGYVEGGDSSSTARLVFNPAAVVSIPQDACVVHPTTLDASLHAILAAIETNVGHVPLAFVPTFIRSATFSGVLGQRKHSTQPQCFRVRSHSKLPGKRVAVNHLSIETEDSSELLVDVDGLELTALGNDSASNGSRRDLFFHGRWLPAFSQLGTALSIPELLNLGELVDMFAHQFPDATILHLTSQEDSVRKVLNILGGVGTKRRRLRSITPFSHLQSSSEQWKKLQSDWPGQVHLDPPIEEQYDLVVLGEAASAEDAVKFVKPGGFILVTDCPTFESSSLRLVFRTGIFQCWQHEAEAGVEFQAEETLMVLLSKSPSALARSVAQIISERYHGKVETVTFAAAPVPPTTHVLSLVALDEDVLYSQPQEDEAAYLPALQQLFGCGSKCIVWLLRGATLEAAQPSQSLMAGLLRTLRSEVADTRIVTLDFAAATGDAAYMASRAVEVLTGCLGEDEFADRAGRLLIPRVETDDARNERLPVPGNRQPSLQPLRIGGRNLALKIGKTGLLDSLVYEDDEETATPDMAPDHVEIGVRASALNFRDIAASMGIIDDYKLGDEASGVVMRSSSPDFRPGDRVLVARPGQGAHRTVIRAPAHACLKIGDSMDFVTASLISGTLCTAYYALVNVARLRPGEWCLIHSAAGGVGQMAIQVAHMLGAKVIATVGTTEKREFLKEHFGLADDVIFSSRDLSFVDGVMAATSGRGFDVALNSLAGELLHGTWKCIAKFGRLVEIGKRDIHENAKLDMEPFRRNVTYASVDIITVYLYDVPLYRELLDTGYRLIRDGVIKPPAPVRIFRYGEAQKAFRLLQMGKFFGKVVLVPEDREVVPVMPPAYLDRQIFKPDKSYLLVGGLGGIGRSVAEWMFRKGARQLAFLSRSGANSAEAQDTIDWLEGKGVRVSVFQGSAVDYPVVERCVQDIGHNLGGVFQAVMVLHDTAFSNMTIDQWRRCVYPKVHGTLNLHKATAHLDLDFFVCFSSGASLLGSLGQANYVAANAYMDALMRHRRESGLCGTSIAIGVVDDVGVVAEDSHLSTILDRLGYSSITRDEMLLQIEAGVLSSKGPAEGATQGVDYHLIGTGVNMSRKDVYWARKPLFRNLYANLDLDGGPVTSESTRNLAVALRAAANVEERAQVLTEAFIEKIAQVLGTPTDSIQPKNPLSAYGLDSMVAVEFRKWFAQTVEVEIPIFDILGAKSIEALVLTAAQAVRLESDAISHGQETSLASRDILVQKLTAAPRASSVFMSIERPENIPLSSNQSRLWFLHNFMEDPSSLCWIVTHRIEGTLRLDVAQRALNELVKRNGVLRTRYFEGEEYTQQELVEDYNVNISFQDLTLAADVEDALSKSVASLQDRPIDITNGESMRALICQLGPSSYCLAFVFHHVACDGGSARSIVGQLVPLYEALTRGEDVTGIPAPLVSYQDFAVWQNRLMESPKAHDDINWWRQTLEGLPPASSCMPFAKGSRQTGNRGRQTVTGSIAPSQVKRMKRLATQANATIFNFVTAAFRAFHYRYTGEDDLAVLMVDGDRPHSDLDDVVGFFVNMVPLRLRGACDGSFEHLLEHVREVTLGSLEHRHVSFDKIVQALRLDHAATHFPIGQVAINYQVYGNQSRVKGTEFEIVDIQLADMPTFCDMSLEILEDPAAGLALKLQYDSRLYGDYDMERFLENFVTFLSSAIRDHRQPVSEINMCGQKELKYLREKCWNVGVEPDPWCGQTVIGKILEMADTYPQATAVQTSDDESITYRDLLSRGKQIAMRLQTLNACLGDTVGILLHPGVDMVAAALGAVLAGCGYAALDASFAVERLRHMTRDSSISIVLASPELMGLAGEICNGDARSSILAISSPTKSSSFSAESALSLASVVAAWSPITLRPDSPFYVIYTSGSTGKPKGVLHTHRTTQAMLSTHNAIHRFSPQDRILFQSSLAFDLSVAQVWGALTAGATLLVAKQDIRKDPRGLANFMHRAGVTVTYFPATQFATLLEHSAADLRRCATYRRAIFAGETLPVRLVRAIYDLGIDVSVCNQYGPSETSVQSSSSLVAYPGSSDVAIPVGRPIANCPHYIVDQGLHAVPATVVGEVCIGGPQVSPGYLNLPEETAARFVDDLLACEAFCDRGWATMYRSGDTAVFRPDGQLDFRGRINGDRQIKLRGYRIDLAEVENELYAASLCLSAPAATLANVAVIPRELGCRQEGKDDSDCLADEHQLVAFLKPLERCTSDGQQALVDVLHKALRRHLNEYMLPSAYQFIDDLSNLVSGKIGLQRLLNIELDPFFPSTGGTISRFSASGDDANSDLDGIFRSIASLFKLVLKLSDGREVTPTDSFFDLGGSSLLVLRLVAAIQRDMGVKVEVRELFAHPTLGEIARLVAEAKGMKLADSGKSSPSPPVSRGDVDWRVEATLPDESAYYPRKSAQPLAREDIKGILITGAERPYGLAMLARLLTTRPDLHISVLGSLKRLSIEEIWTLLQRTGATITQDQLSGIHIVPGSLSQPLFGLDEAQFADLACRTQVIYHFGGYVSLLQPYSELRGPNVQGTLDVIRLAAMSDTHRTELHYLSTWSVPHLQSWPSTLRTKSNIVTDEVPASHFVPAPGPQLAYLKVRWVLEELVARAAERGLAVSIFRPSAMVPEMDHTPITSATASSSSSTDVLEENYVLGLVIAVARSGLVPDQDRATIDLVTPRYIAATIARLTLEHPRLLPLSHETTGGAAAATVLHIRNPRSMALRDLATELGRVPKSETVPVYAPALVPLGEWAERISAMSVMSEGGADAGSREVLAAVFREYLALGHVMFSLDDTETRAKLLDIGLDVDHETLPAVDASFLARLMRYGTAAQGR